MRRALAVALVFCGFFGTSPRAIARAFELKADPGGAVLVQPGASAACDSARTPCPTRRN